MILITGTVKSGTSLMALWLGKCGFDIGLTEKYISWYEEKLTEPDDDAGHGRPPTHYPTRGGVEFLVAKNTRPTARQGEIPEVVKQPWNLMPESTSPMETLDDYGISTPDTVILLKRSIDSVASSIYAVGMSDGRFHRRLKDGRGVPSHRDIMHFAADRWMKLYEVYPHAIIVDFPRYVSDFEFLWDRIGHIVITRASKAVAKAEFDRLADPKLVRH
jgi:hypothetical protein